MTKKQNTQTKVLNKNNKKEAADSKSKQMKTGLKKLYKELDNYFAINVYYETTNKQHPNPFARLLLKRVTEISKNTSKPTILELGLNPGILSIEVALKNAKACGIDKSPMKVVIAENLKHIEYDKFELIQKIDDYKLPIENLLTCKFHVNNLNDLHFDDNYFDIIFSNQAIDTTNIEEILNEAIRCLKPKGELIISFNLKEKLFLDNDSSKILNTSTIQNWVNNKNLEIISNTEITQETTKNPIIKFLNSFNISIFKGKAEAIIYHLKKK